MFTMDTVTTHSKGWLSGLCANNHSLRRTRKSMRGQNRDFPMTYFSSAFSFPLSLGVQLRQETHGAHGHQFM